jgi:hypothetical protein
VAEAAVVGKPDSAWAVLEMASTVRRGSGRVGRLQSRNDVGVHEVVPFEQQRLARILGERVGEAVTEVEPAG